MKLTGFLFVAVTVLLLACNNQQNKADKNLKDDALLVENAKVEEDKDSNSGEPQSVDDLVKEAAIGGMAEVELGRYVEQNAVNPRVKNFGSMMVRDHTKANEELKSIASQKNIQLPASMDDQHMNNVNELKKKQGAELDKDYMRDMVDDHEKDVDKFRKQSENGKDSEIKAFAAKTLPVLQMHLDSAKTIRDALK
jgi:putative membrane protein